VRHELGKGGGEGAKRLLKELFRQLFRSGKEIALLHRFEMRGASV
jgi:hypothetical protein